MNEFLTEMPRDLLHSSSSGSIQTLLSCLLLWCLAPGAVKCNSFLAEALAEPRGAQGSRGLWQQLEAVESSQRLEVPAWANGQLTAALLVARVTAALTQPSGRTSLFLQNANEIINKEIHFKCCFQLGFPWRLLPYCRNKAGLGSSPVWEWAVTRMGTQHITAGHI